MFERVLVGGDVVTEQGVQALDIALRDGKIAALVPRGTHIEAAETVDLAGMVVLPGIVDTHSHLGSGDDRTAEGQDRSFSVDTKDAAIGGVTPCTRWSPGPSTRARGGRGWTLKSTA
jgi:dihydroorotase-like cyclic amidohydrolase